MSFVTLRIPEKTTEEQIKQLVEDFGEVEVLSSCVKFLCALVVDTFSNAYNLGTFESIEEILKKFFLGC